MQLFFFLLYKAAIRNFSPLYRHLHKYTEYFPYLFVLKSDWSFRQNTNNSNYKSLFLSFNKIRRHFQTQITDFYFYKKLKKHNETEWWNRILNTGVKFIYVKTIFNKYNVILFYSSSCREHEMTCAHLMGQRCGSQLPSC